TWRSAQYIIWCCCPEKILTLLDYLFTKSEGSERGDVMDLQFCTDIISQIVNAVEAGNHHLVFWGLNSNCIYIMSELKRLGILDSYVTGIVDSKAGGSGRQVQGIDVSPPDRISTMDID